MAHRNWKSFNELTFQLCRFATTTPSGSSTQAHCNQSPCALFDHKLHLIVTEGGLKASLKARFASGSGAYEAEGTLELGLQELRMMVMDLAVNLELTSR